MLSSNDKIESNRNNNNNSNNSNNHKEQAQTTTRIAPERLRLKLQQLSSKVDQQPEFHLARSLGKLVQATRCKCGLASTNPPATTTKDQLVRKLSQHGGGAQLRPPLPGQQLGRSASIAQPTLSKPQLVNKRRSLIAGLLGAPTRPQVAQGSGTISSLLTAAAAARRRQKRTRTHTAANELRHNAAKLLLITLAAVWLLATATGQAAPIFTAVRPIWLTDGLMTVADATQPEELDQAVEQRWLEPATSWRRAAKRNEHFWIERRRLNRDRALEPPAWLRERPIRRDQTIEERPEVDDSEQRDQESLERARQPSRAVGRGRQSRESSSELYAELLRHLIEDALEGRSTLADFYDQLEPRASNFSPNQDGQAASQLQQQQSADKPEQLKTGSSPSDQTLVVAGDEISATNDDEQLAGSAGDQQQRAPAGSALAVVQRLAPVPSLGLQKQQAGEFVRLPARLGQSASAGQLQLELSLAPVSSLEAAQVAPPAASEEETFHVIEDIDRVVDASSQASDLVASNSQSLPPVVQLEELEFESPAGVQVDQELSAPTSKAKREASRESLAATAFATLPLALVEREQLIKLAGKLRALLENSLHLGRNSIVGLFPINARQLLVELDPQRLDAQDRAQLAANFAYTRDSAELVLSWPSGEQSTESSSSSSKSPLSANENPIPILQIILESLNNNNNNNDDGDQLATRFQQQKKFAVNQEQNEEEEEFATSAGANKQDVWSARLRNGLGGEPLEPSSWWAELEARRVDPQTSLAALATYLNVVQAQRDVGVPEAAAFTRQQNHTSSFLGSSPFYIQGGASYALVLALALMSVCLIVKLLAGKIVQRARRKIAKDNEQEEEEEEQTGDDTAKSTTESASFVQTFWPFASAKQPAHQEATIKGTTEANGSGRTLNDANVRKLSADSGRETLLALDSETSSLAPSTSQRSRASRALRNKLNLLGARWATFTSGRRAEARQEAHEEPIRGQQSGGTNAAGFRTSTSYIKSLIEALTKSPAGELSATNERSSDNSESQLNYRDENSSEGDEIVTSQMDISAAHLILDYMEKHLIDKERLRREWLELNAGTGKQVGGAGGAGDKRSGGGQRAANQLIVQRLARVALADENAHKNRHSSIVPFDRNRVRLGTRQRPLSSGSSASARNGNNNKLRNGKKTSGDYVNASFIHDDDPRRPTHIIAQGPLDETCGQFWQMIWEQEISVIVMLTRLNENGQQQCACYWPTNIAATPTSAAPPNNVAPGAKSGASQLRRGSVTSVFSGGGAGALNHHAQQQHPIVAPSGDPNDNVLYFEVPLASASGTPRLSEDGEEGPEVSGRGSNSSQRTMKLEVHLISEHVSSSDYLVRNMYLVNGTTGEARTISQFHYLAWPAGRTPDQVRNFLQFRRKVHKSYRQLAAPILVHCSDGAGRSGTYALIDMILERIKNGAKEIDLRATLEHLRDQRVGLCETQSQFEFVLVALAEEIQIILEALPQ